MAARQEVTLVIRARDLTRRAFRRISGAFRSLRGQIASIVATFAGLQGARAVGQFAQDVENIAAQSGVGVEAVQAFADAFRRFGIDLNDVGDIFFSLQQAQSEALNFDARQLEAFRRLGVDAQTLRNADPAELIIRLAAAAQNLPRRQFQEFFSTILGEDNARRIFPLLAGGPEPLLDALNEAAKKRVASEEDIARVADLNADAQNAAQLALVKGVEGAVTVLDLFDDTSEKLETLNQRLDETAESVRLLGDSVRQRLDIEEPVATERSGAPLLPGDTSFS